MTIWVYVCCFQLKSRCEELKLDWGSLCLESLLKEKQALRRQISEKQRHCLELQVQFTSSICTSNFQMLGCIILALLVHSSILAVVSDLLFHPDAPFHPTGSSEILKVVLSPKL